MPAAEGVGPLAPEPLPGRGAGPPRTADGFSGLPQSMQKRDATSFSRPQKAQDLTRGPPAG